MYNTSIIQLSQTELRSFFCKDFQANTYYTVLYSPHWLTYYSLGHCRSQFIMPDPFSSSSWHKLQSHPWSVCRPSVAGFVAQLGTPQSYQRQSRSWHIWRLGCCAIGQLFQHISASGQSGEHRQGYDGHGKTWNIKQQANVENFQDWRN